MTRQQLPAPCCSDFDEGDAPQAVLLRVASVPRQDNSSLKKNLLTEKQISALAFEAYCRVRVAAAVEAAGSDRHVLAADFGNSLNPRVRMGRAARVAR